jgi:hypothetical protein
MMMDAIRRMGIHETQLEGLRECSVVFFNFNQLFGLVPFVTQVNTHLNCIGSCEF